MRQVRRKRENPGQFVGCYMYLVFSCIQFMKFFSFFMAAKLLSIFNDHYK